MSHTQPMKLEFFPGKQENKTRAECPECIEYYFTEEELDDECIPRKWVGSGEDGHMFKELSHAF